MRVNFEKGKQREFLEKVMVNTGSPSLKELQNRLVEVSYSSLKNYFCERRNLSEEVFLDLCRISSLDKVNFKFEVMKDSWGQSKGGKVSKRKNGPTKNRT